MRITSSAICLTVDDVAASVAFFTRHFGFRTEMEADGFASLGRDDAAPSIVLMRRGIDVLPEKIRNQRAEGVIVVFTVDDLAGEEARLRAEGVDITMPLREEPWGERLFMVTGPNDVIVELVEWVTPASDEAGSPA
ncbi:VOC family protein [Streptomyces sp. XD-27]|uniref:VOC family protein n=1 Tax=Streptomyces sp. XD-27 TaxID=3062779 RepID=UPI0026F44C0E|nr:VOC family protein [Streptomyces sp. XD-27]WKX71687.1 VOC family protein [Streptomyces sp. XD-27]